jgi:hypothetical protein
MLLQDNEDHRVDLPGPAASDRLYVAWQDPESREIRPVAILSSIAVAEGTLYDFRYLRDARRAPFRPFLQFPDLDATYQAEHLFAMFENRVMPSGRPDYQDYLGSLGLPIEAAPFELLAASFGLRATDSVEVFQEPIVDPETGLASCRFLARGVRYLEGAQEAIASLVVGDHLSLEPEPSNPKDPRALRLLTRSGIAVGFVPAYLVDFLHGVAVRSGFEQISVRVHGCDPGGAYHLMLLCVLSCEMPPDGFGDESLEPIVSFTRTNL